MANTAIHKSSQDINLLKSKEGLELRPQEQKLTNIGELMIRDMGRLFESG